MKEKNENVMSKITEAFIFLIICFITTNLTSSCRKTEKEESCLEVIEENPFGNIEEIEDTNYENIEEVESVRFKNTEKKQRLEYTESEAVIELFNARNSWDIEQLRIEETIKREGSPRSARWDNIDTITGFSIGSVLDYRKYEKIGMWVYSAKKTNSVITIRIFCQPSMAFKGETAYFYTTFLTEWEGWKYLEFDLSSFQSNYKPDYSKASSVSFGSTTFGTTPDPETVLCFDRIELIGKKYSYNMSELEISPFFDAVLNNVEKLLIGENDYSEYFNGKYGRDISEYRNDGLPFNEDMSSYRGMTSNYAKILEMSTVYASNGRSDKELLKSIQRSLSYMHENYYADRNLHKFDVDNWYAWQIDVPMFIVNILTLIRNDISADEISKYLEPVKLNNYMPSDTFSNRIEMAYSCIVSSALEKNYERLVLSRDLLDECFLYVDSGDGFYIDGSFLYHEIVPYNGDYGLVMLDQLSSLVLILKDTCFSFSETNIDKQIKWIRNSFEPFIYKGSVSGSVRGRAITIDGWTDQSQGLTALKGMLRIYEYVDDYADKSYISGLINDWYLNNKDYYEENLDPFSLFLLSKITMDKKQYKYDLVKYFPMMDRLAVQKENYAFYLSMSSSRIAKYEAINNQNGEGWYTGEGMTYLYLSPFDYDGCFWKEVDKYSLPGTTVSNAERVDENISCYDTLTDCDFVGGLSYDNKYAVAAMSFKSASDNMDFESDLSGNKSWFVFDDVIVCLGNSISSSDNTSVKTVIENRRINSENVYCKNNIILIKDMESIVLLDNHKSHIERQEDYTQIYINHGEEPSNETYAYAVLPNSNEQNIEECCNKLIVHQNDSKATVVGYKDDEIIAIVFWEACRCNDIEASAPCVVLLNDEKIIVCDPTMMTNTIRVDVAEKTYLFSNLQGGGQVEMNR